MTNKWQNYGDVNAIAYGGTFIKQDADSPSMYHIVELINMEWAANEPGFFITTASVDVDDEWINWDRVKTSYGIDGDDNSYPETLALAAFGYYGFVEFGGYDIQLDTEEQVMEELNSYGITEEDFK